MIKYIRRWCGRHVLWVGVMGGLLLGLPFLAGSGLIAHDSKPGEAWLPIKPEAVEWRIGLVGRIGPATLQTITAPFAGNILAVHAIEGQRVQPGQLLVELDTTDIDVRLREANAELLKAQRAAQVLRGWEQGVEANRARRVLANARINLADTVRKLADTRLLFQRGIVARMEVDALEQQSRAQQLEVSSAQAELAATLAQGSGENRHIAEMGQINAQAKYDDIVAMKARARLVAPYAGIMARAPVGTMGSSTSFPQAGARVSEGQPLMRLAGIEQLRVVAKVDETDINAMREGMPVTITGDGFPGLVLSGQIEVVGRLLVEDGGQAEPPAYEVAVAINPVGSSQHDQLRLGMSARLNILSHRSDQAIVVPVSAVRSADGGWFVISRSGPGAPPTRVPVSVGRTTEKGVEVTGLGEGEVLLVGSPGQE
ncbi:efflux RND transporter periplasmic adaptor subunit [Achromobacter xylosoxidans]|uniref:efflux RND transporter periplasmic adaptor subunit n=1 Tax=Alcaligenes xylosoxydans xylosoxydans TaxID=85698 RepID=UPI0015E871A2|nr:HlyD family efflux transporter periplasmic adaptor subunit [Achromobacter xylosoxidans]